MAHESWHASHGISGMADQSWHTGYCILVMAYQLWHAGYCILVMAYQLWSTRSARVRYCELCRLQQGRRRREEGRVVLQGGVPGTGGWSAPQQMSNSAELSCVCVGANMHKMSVPLIR
jgi:hypothetical protein